MKLAKEIREALEDINAGDAFALGEGLEVIDELIAAKLEPVKELARIVSEAMGRCLAEDAIAMMISNADKIREVLALFEEE